MARNDRSKTNISIERMTHKILERGKLNRQEYLLLATTLLSGWNLTEEDSNHINRVFDFLQVGRIELVSELKDG